MAVEAPSPTAVDSAIMAAADQILAGFKQRKGHSDSFFSSFSEHPRDDVAVTSSGGIAEAKAGCYISTESEQLEEETTSKVGDCLQSPNKDSKEGTSPHRAVSPCSFSASGRSLSHSNGQEEPQEPPPLHHLSPLKATDKCVEAVRREATASYCHKASLLGKRSAPEGPDAVDGNSQRQRLSTGEPSQATNSLTNATCAATYAQDVTNPAKVGHPRSSVISDKDVSHKVQLGSQPAGQPTWPVHMPSARGQLLELKQTRAQAHCIGNPPPLKAALQTDLPSGSLPQTAEQTGVVPSTGGPPQERASVHTTVQLGAPSQSSNAPGALAPALESAGGPLKAVFQHPVKPIRTQKQFSNSSTANIQMGPASSGVYQSNPPGMSSRLYLMRPPWQSHLYHQYPHTYLDHRQYQQHMTSCPSPTTATAAVAGTSTAKPSYSPITNTSTDACSNGQSQDSCSTPREVSADFRNQKMEPTDCLLFAASLLQEESRSTSKHESTPSVVSLPSCSTDHSHSNSFDSGARSSQQNVPIQPNLGARRHSLEEQKGLPLPLQAHQEQEKPNDLDVLCGRGGLINKHVGNVVYRRVVEYNKPFYQKVQKRHRILVSQSIVHTILNRGGRFLSEDSRRITHPDGSTSTISGWKTVPTAKAVQKTSQALRERPVSSASSSVSTYEVAKTTRKATEDERSDKPGLTSEAMDHYCVQQGSQEETHKESNQTAASSTT